MEMHLFGLKWQFPVVQCCRSHRATVC